MAPRIGRRLAVVTGGCGGIGAACAREFGKTHDLLLVDISRERLAEMAAHLSHEGYPAPAVVAGDLAEHDTVTAIAAHASRHGALGAVLHTAGVSSGMVDWRSIIRTNVLGTGRLLDAIEPILPAGAVAVLIASVAGHVAPADPAVDAILDHPEVPDFMDRVGTVLTEMGGGVSDSSFNYSGLSGPAYGLSKRATIRAAALRAAAWAAKGARIVSISPGLIDTPMGRYEVEHGEAAAQVLAETPLRRWGMPTDISQAASFLTSDAASFITGTDLRVDGGMVPVRLGSACF